LYRMQSPFYAFGQGSNGMVRAANFC
jgi:hypothetical protein